MISNEGDGVDRYASRFENLAMRRDKYEDGLIPHYCEMDLKIS